jgi:hypothetical protein
MKNNRCFTITEVLVAIGVSIIILGTSLVVLSNFSPSIELNGTATDLVSDLRYAQQLAVSEQIKHGIQFFSAENRYQLIKYGETEEIVKEKNFPEGIFFQLINGLSLNRVLFNPYGSVEEDGTVVIQNGTGTKTILIKPSGFISFE